MRELDCESAETALAGLAALFGVGDSTLAAELSSFAFESVPERLHREHPYEDLLCHHLGYQYETLPTPKVIYWFHATRVLSDVDFAEGILPLPDVLERVWANLEGLAADWSSPEEWRHFRTNMKGQGARQYRTKLTYQPEGGPFAHLVKPVVFEAGRVGNHDYLAVPEIVEDICLSYNEMLGHDLLGQYRSATTPCIVKFRHAGSWPGAVRAALMFVHHWLTDRDYSIHCSTCFDGRGIRVAPEQLVAIERVEA